jgi:hypothetical protein
MAYVIAGRIHDSITHIFCFVLAGEVRSLGGSLGRIFPVWLSVGAYHSYP